MFFSEKFNVSSEVKHKDRKAFVGGEPMNAFLYLIYEIFCMSVTDSSILVLGVLK